MNVNINGIRKNATRSMVILYDSIDSLLENENISKESRLDLCEKFDEAARAVTMINCIYDNSVDGDFDDLSHIDCNYFDEDK